MRHSEYPLRNRYNSRADRKSHSMPPHLPISYFIDPIQYYSIAQLCKWNVEQLWGLLEHIKRIGNSYEE